MNDQAATEAATFPAPVRIDGYLAWTWRLFRASFLRLAPVFAAGVLFAFVGYYAGVVLIVEGLEVDASVEALAVAFAARVMLSTIAGTLLAAIAATVYLERLAGRSPGADAGWRRLKPMFGHAMVAALYLAMPLLLLVLFLGEITNILLLPALLGPPVLVHAIVWEQLEFREAAGRAKNLLAGNWARVISALFVLAVGPALVQILALGLLENFLPDLTDADLAAGLWAAIVVAVATAPVWLFTTAAGTVAYLDLRARFEELDRDALVAEAEKAAATT